MRPAMPSFAFSRPRLAEWRDWLPPALLLIALSALFIFGEDRDVFYRQRIHSQAVARTLALAENSSPSLYFRQFIRAYPKDDGELHWDLYGRFPLGGPILLKFAIAPFGDDLSAKILAAHILALLMFCGAALFAYLAIARIAGSRWTALAAALIGLSGLHTLYYSDGLFSDAVMDLLGVMLAFHGAVVFLQEGRFRQLILKSCAALLLGWHVYGVLLALIVFGFGAEAFASLRRSKDRRRALIALVRSRYILLGAAALAFGAALLALNFANEYAAFDGEKALSELPSFDSLTKRTGWRDDYMRGGDWLAKPEFWGRQLMRVGVESVPYAVARRVDGFAPLVESANMPPAAVAAGALLTGAAIAGLALVRRDAALPLAVLALFGFFWAIPMRNHTRIFTHDFEGIFYVGIPMALLIIALTLAAKPLGKKRAEWIAVALGLVAVPIFALSAFHAIRVDSAPIAPEFARNILAEMGEMRAATRGKSVQVSQDVDIYSRVNWLNVRYTVAFALAGSYVAFDGEPARADFVVSRYRDESFNLLTPDNDFVFLYADTDLAELYRAERRRLESREPAARSVFDVYLEGDTLRYLKAPCAPGDTLPLFFLHVYPAAGGDPLGFDGASFLFSGGGKTFDDVCITLADLPDYPIAAIRTGQYVPGGERTWDAFIIPPLDAEALAFYEKTYQAIASGEPAARSDFDVYLDGDTLSYLKAPCDANDARGRFLLSVYPTDVRDLPPERRDIGHDSLNFDFAPPIGAIFNGKCMANRRLPDYGITKIETGQWIPGGERLWDVEIVVSR